VSRCSRIPRRANCASCHVVLSRAGQPPVFTDYDFLNVGVPRKPTHCGKTPIQPTSISDCVAPRGAISRVEPSVLRLLPPPPTMRKRRGARTRSSTTAFFNSLRDVLHFYVERDIHPENWYSHKS